MIKLFEQFNNEQEIIEICKKYNIENYTINSDGSIDVNGGVTLTIPKAIEVEIFRSGPSYWWLPHKKPEMPVHMIAGSESPFLKQKFPQIAKKKLGIPYTVFNGGHMFPLEHPVEIVDLIRDLIKKI